SQAGQEDEREHHDDLLRRPLFGGRPDLHTSLEELGILEHKIRGEREIAGEKDRDEDPRLPVVEGPRREEKQHSRNGYEKKVLNRHFHIQLLIHRYYPPVRVALPFK